MREALTAQGLPADAIQLVSTREDVQELLKLKMRLGEGSGAALALPLVRAATDFLNQMASFESAGVADRETGT